MFIDTHIHESKYSLDSKFSLEQAVKKAKEIGLNGICITDHESNNIREEALEYGKKNNFLIIVGAEVLTYQGDVVVFGLKDIPQEKIEARELLLNVKEAKGVAIAAHPFRNNNRGMGNYIREVKELLFGIEAFNGSTEPHQNLFAYALATELGLPAFGASDAHLVERVGKYSTVFPDGIRDEQDFIFAVKNGMVHPAIRKKNTFEEIDIYININNKRYFSFA